MIVGLITWLILLSLPWGYIYFKNQGDLEEQMKGYETWEEEI